MQNLKIVFTLFSLFLCSTLFAQINTKRTKIKSTTNITSKYPGKSHNIQTTKKDLPDLVVTFIEYTSGGPFVEGAAMGVVKYGVKNIGNAPAKSSKDDPAGGGYFIDLVLSTDDMPPAGLAIYSNQCNEDVLLRGGRTSGKTIEVGEVVTFIDDNLELPVGCDCTSGSFIARFGVNIDPDNKMAELNDGNNWMSQTLPVDCKKETSKGIPDLVITNVEFEYGFDGFSEGQPMGEIRVTIENFGDAAAVAPYFVDLFLSSDVTPPRGNPARGRASDFREDILLGNGGWPPLTDAAGNYNAGRMEGRNLAPGESVVLTSKGCVAPTNFPNCSGGQAALQFGVFVDSTKKVAESNEDNNIDFRTFLIKCGK